MSISAAQKARRRLFLSQVALVGFAALPAKADTYYYQNPGGGDWDSSSDPYWSWYDLTTNATTGTNFPPDNGVPSVILENGIHGVSNANILLNHTYSTGIHDLTVGSGNTLTQSGSGSAMLVTTLETVGALTAGTYTQSAGSNSPVTLQVGTGGGAGVYNLSASGSVNATTLNLGSAGPASSFNQSGGSVQISGNMSIGPSSGYSGLYSQTGGVGSSRVDLQACKLEYSIVSPK